jgi:hypothetical protein
MGEGAEIVRGKSDWANERAVHERWGASED